MLYFAACWTTFLRRSLLLRCLWRTDEKNTADSQGNLLLARACSQGPSVGKAATWRHGWAQEWRPYSHCFFAPLRRALLKSRPFGLFCHSKLNRNTQIFPFPAVSWKEAGEPACWVMKSNENTHYVPGSVLSAFWASSYLVFKCLWNVCCYCPHLMDE